MTLIWNIKLYRVSRKTGFRVKISACPPETSPVWVFGDGKGKTPHEAYAAAIKGMNVEPWLSAEQQLPQQQLPKEKT